MTRRKSISIRAKLKRLFPTTWLERTARETGAVKRQRRVKIGSLFWTLVLGFGGGSQRTLAGLRRAYEKVTGQPIEESSFYDRFSQGMVELLEQAVVRGLKTCMGAGRAVESYLKQFADVVITDATVFRLHELLGKEYPACRTNHTKAALKGHFVINVQGVGRQSVKFTSERVHDGPVFKVGQWVKNHLLLFDLGYFKHWLFARIGEEGGFFISRLKASSNPKIVAINRRHRGRAVPVVGERLQDVVGRMKREVLDVMAEFRFKRRSYGGKQRSDKLILRVVGLRDEASGEYHLYVSNVPTDKLTPQDIRATYALRWLIELLFKELKDNYRMDDLPSRKKEVVLCLLYAAILTLIVSRNILYDLRRKLGQLGDRVPTQRWARLVGTMAHDMLLLVLGPPKQLAWLEKHVTTTLLHEAIDPNANRPGLLAQVEQGIHRYATQCVRH